MNYELAKKLKDAGLPSGSEVTNGCVVLPQEKYPHWVSPHLSELIEACGEHVHFQLVHEQNGRWIATKVFPHYYGEGSTPEEAVANLWLALNTEKDVTRQSLNP